MPVERRKRGSRAWTVRQEVSQDATSALEHASKLEVYSRPSQFRHTAIICTIGAKTSSVEALTALRKAGMNIMRLNFSHGSREDHSRRIANLRQSVAEMLDGRLVGVALDTKGPEIRTGTIKLGELPEQTVAPILEVGQSVTVSTDPAMSDQCSSSLIYLDYAQLPSLMRKGEVIYIDDGLISLSVTATDPAKAELTCEVTTGGTLYSNRGVNLPQVSLDLPALSARDQADLAFGVAHGIDMVFASFIRKASDVQQIRACLVAADAERGPRIRIISKIENHEGVRNFDAILAETDGVMVARGDLGIEIPAEKVFLAQKAMIAKCNLAGKPVICATQMLESMTTNPRPTRAEVSDVANAVLDGADCVMLSGETAKGKYPQEAVEMMSSVCLEAESAVYSKLAMADLTAAVKPPLSPSESIAKAAVEAANNREAVLIFTLTYSGTSARLLAKYRPRCPIIVLTKNASAGAACNLHRGVMPYLCPLDDADLEGEDNADWIESWLQWAIAKKKAENMISEGDSVIFAHGWKSGSQSLSTYRVITVE